MPTERKKPEFWKMMKNFWQTTNWESNLKVPLAAIGFGLLVGGVFVLTIGKNPIDVYLAIWKAMFGSPRAFLDVIGQATPPCVHRLGCRFRLPYRHV